MKRNWTKAEWKHLRDGNPGKLRKWIRDYTDSLFTWVTIHYSLDADHAADRTGRIFQGAYAQLNTYDPADSSMYRWLIQRAQFMFPEENPRRPQASSQILRALGLIGSAEIPDALLENPAVIQLIQAALTEMDESERMILLRRYHRIDQEAAAEVDVQFSSDSLGDQLVRARYYFRRHLLAGIYAIAPDIGEFSPDSRIPVFEKNLEKIFCSVPPALKLPEAAAEEIENVLLQQAQLNQAGAKSPGTSLSRKTAWITGIVVFLTAATGLWFFLRDQSTRENPPPVQSKIEDKTEPVPDETAKQGPSPEELKRYMARVFEAGSNGDIQGLLEVLEEGPYPAQVAAAVFLGRIGDESAIGPLEKAARRRHPDPQETNPFLTAIEQIEQRLSRQAEEEALAQQAEDQQTEEIQPVETAVPPAEPNQKTVVQPVQPIPADNKETPTDLQEETITEEQTVSETQEEVWEDEEMPAEEVAEEQEDYPAETQEPNEIDTEETEWTEEEYSTDDVQYIEEPYEQTEY